MSAKNNNIREIEKQLELDANNKCNDDAFKQISISSSDSICNRTEPLPKTSSSQSLSKQIGNDSSNMSNMGDSGSHYEDSSSNSRLTAQYSNFVKSNKGDSSESIGIFNSSSNGSGIS